MKKLMLSMVIAISMLFSMSASAIGISATSLSQFSTTQLLLPAGMFMVIASQYEPRACDSEPSRVGKHATGSNYFFSVGACEYKDNPSAYTLK